jgi:shikimate dehydrogenase
MPHKQAICGLLDARTREAERAGAVNVVRREPDGHLFGTLLDGEGFVAGLRGAGCEVRGRDCLVLGAGGAAAAIAFALADHGCRSLALANRTPAHAEALAARVRAAHPQVAVGTGIESAARYDLAVNATPLGMRASDPLPLDDDTLARCALVAECVLAPEQTALLARARQRGVATHGGLAMLRAQLPLMLEFIAGAPRNPNAAP